MQKVIKYKCTTLTIRKPNTTRITKAVSVYQFSFEREKNRRQEQRMAIGARNVGSKK